MSQEQEIKVECDPVTGLCKIIDSKDTVANIIWNDDEELLYVGDPMCSWCWGISPQINALQRYATQKKIKFNLLMGGLRTGGGQEWDTPFKRYLRHHWQEVGRRSGQPFDLSLFDEEYFNYDTEPACRAVVTTRTVAPEKVLAFYELVQYYFYAKSQDPKELDFYKPICETLDMDYKEFVEAFTSEEMIAATQADFAKSRAMGVRGFPTVLYRQKDELHVLATGYTSFEKLKKSILKLRDKKSTSQ